MSDDEELDAIRQRKLEAMRDQALQERIQEQQIAEREVKKESILRQILTPEARARLTNIRMVRPQFAEQLEMQLIELANAGKLKEQVSDQQLRALLAQIQGRERERKVTFR
jgi:programmed cell death protein 5